MSLVKRLEIGAQLSQGAKQEIEHWLTKYPDNQRQSAVIAALTYVQKENGGFLTTSLMDAVALYLGMPKIAVYEVASFYNMFELNPIGRHKISVCTSVACLLNGSDETLKYISHKLNISVGETTQDNKFTLKKAECLAACGMSPMMRINEKYHEHLTPAKIDKILDGLE